MKSKNNQREPLLSPLTVENKATEKLKRRAQDLGLITNAGADKAAKPMGKKKDGSKCASQKMILKHMTRIPPAMACA